ncbi:MAG: hypothetical protein DI537_40830 [Stutzerimonas stutzeri]|nr:MAG: hypothetical protein DI537_40830 [Stutzerimonas stutzeri]
MLLSDLFETASLPLAAQQLPRVRGSYGAFIITMSPEDFLALTTSDAEELKSITDRPFPYDKEKYVDRLGREEGYGRYDLPFLKVRFPSGEIFGHEGRHRSAMVARAGGKKIPVVIYPYEQNEYDVTVSYYDLASEDEGKSTESLGIFNDLPSAEAAGEKRKAELEANEDMWSVKVKIDYLRGGTLKGAPERSEGWDRAAWRVSDFPHQLIGQYNPSIVVKDFRVGLVKGYRHFTR